MIRKRMIVLSILFIVLFQIFAPTFYKCFATNEITENIIEVTDEGKIEEYNEQNTDENIQEIEGSQEMEKIENKEIENGEIVIFEEETENTENTIDEVVENVFSNEEEEQSEDDLQEKIEILPMFEENQIMLLGAGEFYVADEAGFRYALENHFDVIKVNRSIDFSSPIFINYSVTVIDASEDNALRYGNGGSFITVQNGGSLTLDGMVVDTNSSGNSGMTAINIEAGGTVTFVNSSIVDGGIGNTGILVNSGAKLLLWSSHFVRCGVGINLQTNGNLEFATQEGRINNFYWNKTAVLIDNFYGICSFNQNISMHDNSEYGIYIANSSGSVNISAGDYYNNTYAVRTANGTVNISGGSYYANGWAIWCGGNINLTGGDIYGNYYGVITDGSYNGCFNMIGGNIHDNSAHAIQHQKTNDGGCTILGGSISGDIYLANYDNYVNTNSSYPIFTVTPSSYFFKRKLVKTSNDNTAKSEINNVSFTPKDYWYKNVLNEYIVLWKDGNIIVKCYDKDFSNVPLCGATFNICDESGNLIQTLTTDNNGMATSKKLPAGINYIINQNTAIKNYSVNLNKVNANFTDETYTAEFPNEHDKGHLSITKLDKDDNSKILAGVIFKLYANNIDKPYKSGDLIGTYKTDENGKIVVNNIWTGSYFFVETETLKTYNLDTTNNEVIINKNETTISNIANEKKKDKIKIYLKDDDTDMPLDNIEFDIVDEDGKIIDIIKTDEEGHAISKELPIDEKYTVIQKNYKDNYVQNEDKIEVDFIKEFGYEDDQIYIVDIKNKHKKGNIKFNKIDYDNNEISLEGFVFELYVKNVDKPYKSGDLINTYTTNENGEIEINDLWIGEYYFIEQESDASKYYQLIDNDIEVKVDTDTTTEFSVTNEKKKGKIEISKKVSADYSEITSNEKGTLLEGAEFEIVNNENDVVDIITTDKNGYAISKGLPIDNNYKIREIKAPEYYLLNDMEENVKFSENGEVRSLEWKDEAIKVGVEVEQKGIIETQVNDLIKYDLTSLKNKSNVEIDNFTFEDNLPYEFVSLRSLYTGTYNYEHDYEIWYKTEGNEEWNQIINQNSDDGKYSTLNDNYIDFTFTTATITDIRIEFGKVENDFSAIEEDMPFIFTRVLDITQNKDKWNNIINLTGKYISNKNNIIDVKDSSEWNTRCYSKTLNYDDSNKGYRNKENSIKQNEKRKILPRTGM